MGQGILWFGKTGCTDRLMWIRGRILMNNYVFLYAENH